MATRSVFRNLSRGGLNFLSLLSQHSLGPENPLKSIDFTGPGGGLSLKSPPPEYAPHGYKDGLVVFEV